MDLYLSKSTNQVPTRYSDNMNESNFVINLIFFKPNLLELHNYIIHPEWRYSSDHALLTVDISINKEYVSTKRYIIIKNSEEEDKFITELINNIKRLNHSKLVNITKYSKVW